MLVVFLLLLKGISISLTKVPTLLCSFFAFLFLFSASCLVFEFFSIARVFSLFLLCYFWVYGSLCIMGELKYFVCLVRYCVAWALLMVNYVQTSILEFTQ